LKTFDGGTEKGRAPREKKFLMREAEQQRLISLLMRLMGERKSLAPPGKSLLVLFYLQKCAFKSLKNYKYKQKENIRRVKVEGD
jgi:hypothetical protein